VIRFSLRLSVSGGREAIARLVIIAAAVAIGVALTLAALAGMNAQKAQNNRYTWLNSGLVQADAAQPAASGDPLWWRLQEDYFDGGTIGRVDLAATGPDSPVPPGIPKLPGPGEYYASPALRDLLANNPADQLADRYPGHLVGTIGRDALPSPDSLIIVIGTTPQQLSEAGGYKVTAINTVPPQNCNHCAVGENANGVALVFGVAVGALVFPLLIFIGTATRLAAARREQRFAAMRLVGATPRQISVIATVESTVATVAGTAIGFALFYASRSLLARIPFTGQRFYPSDLAVGWLPILLVALGVPVGAAVAARLALRRVRISPLGVSRRVTPRPPSAIRLIPLLAGLGELFLSIGRVPTGSTRQLEIFLPGFLVTMAGLVIAGPWLTMVGARLLARRSSRPATLIAVRRLGDDPRAAFRAVSGVVLGLFVTSVAVGVITTVVDNRGTNYVGPEGRTVMSIAPYGFNPKDFHSAAPAATVATELSSVPGVRNVVLGYANPNFNLNSRDASALPGVVWCADLTGPDLPHCPPGVNAAQIWPDGVGEIGASLTLTEEQVRALPLAGITVDTDGSTAALERTRTVLEAAFPAPPWPPATRDDQNADFTKTLNQWQQLANVVILATLPIAGCSLAVSVVGGLSERRRPFSLLRLSGAPLRVLRRVVALESAVPLLIVSLVAIGAGLLSAQFFLKAQLHYTLHPPGVGYYAIVLGGLAAALGIIGATLPVLRRITGPEAARNG
jgi:hypothetical protein